MPNANPGPPIARKRSPQTFEKRRREVEKQQKRANKIANRITRNEDKRNSDEPPPELDPALVDPRLWDPDAEDLKPPSEDSET